MAAESIEKENECTHVDDSGNDCFESAVCKIYNDVLNHVIIPNHDDTKLPGNGCAKSKSHLKRSDTFFTAVGTVSSPPPNRIDRTFTAGTVSTKNTMTSSDALSYVISVSKPDDDDLSYITEPEFEERANQANLSNDIHEDARQRGKRRSPLNANVENSEFSNLRDVSNEGTNTLDLSLSRKFTITLSDLDAALISPSATVRNPECSNDSAHDESLSTISTAPG